MYSDVVGQLCQALLLKQDKAVPRKKILSLRLNMRVFQVNLLFI